MKVRFSVRKQEFLVPAVILLRACGVQGDNEIFSRLTSQAGAKDSWVLERVRLLLHDAKQHGIYTSQEALAYVGARFRAVLGRGNERNDVQCGQEVLDKFVIIDQRSLEDKANTMLMCMRKLLSFVGGRCGADNADSLQNLELLLPGHLIATFVKEKTEEQLTSMRKGVSKEIRTRGAKALSELGEPAFWGKICDRYGGGAAGNIGKKVAHFLSTGNIVSSSGLDLMQVSGYTIVAERLNFLRYISHYRSVHRGQFFMTMKTTAVRKLLPDSWGFLCPVHTPDGGPCGLLNHLAVKCETQVRTKDERSSNALHISRTIASPPPPPFARRFARSRPGAWTWQRGTGSSRPSLSSVSRRSSPGPRCQPSTSTSYWMAGSSAGPP